MIPYKMKHKATGLYYKPGRPNLSKIGKAYGTSSKKIFAHIYIDDSALGILLKHDEYSTLPYVDWNGVEILLKMRGIL